jgi:hypothetical protein
VNRRGVLFGLLSALGSGGGCRLSVPDPRGPRLELAWTGSDTATFSAPATAEWCDSLRMLEIRALGSDTGVSLVLYPAGPVGSGRYPVRAPAGADSAPPSSALGLRWFSANVVRGFQGDSGAVRLKESSGGAVSGEFDATAASVTDERRLTLRGTFHGLRVRAAKRGCVSRVPAARTAADTADTNSAPEVD